MDREEAKNHIKTLEPDFLQKAKKKIKGQYTFVCPSCGNGSGTDGDGIIRYKSGYKCFSCGLYEDNIGLWKLSQGITDDKEAFKTLYEHYNINIDQPARQEHQEKKATAPQIEKNEGEKMDKGVIDFNSFFLQANKDIEKTDYHRGITLETLNRFYVGYVENWKHPKAPNAPESPRLIIPVSKYSYIARDTRSNLTEQQEEYKKQKVKADLETTVNWIFNREAIKDAKQPIIVVEGEIDALSIIDVGGEAVGLGSIANIHQFIDYVIKNKPAQPLILSLDNDEREDGRNPGQEAQAELAKDLQENDIKYFIHNVAGNYKDANEYLIANREAFKEAVARAENIEVEEYKKTSVENHIQDFINGIGASVNTPCISTGFYNLDRTLDGGLYEGLYTVGAISSLGKTTLVLQMADQIAQAGQDVIIFSLEMARTELMSKSISRHTIIEILENGGKLETAKTARGITTGKRYQNYSNEERELIKKAISNYSNYASHLYIHEGIGDIGVNQIRSTVEEHIAFTGNKPVIIIDYLQILAPYSDRASDKQNTDKAVLELKRISRDFKIPVIAISSLNRSNYNSKISMEAFKESGAIEYSSDVLIGLQLEGVGQSDFDIDQAKKKNPREIELVILKNRNGSTGDKVSFDYHTLFNYFEESNRAGNLFKTDPWERKRKQAQDFKRV